MHVFPSSHWRAAAFLLASIVGLASSAGEIPGIPIPPPARGVRITYLGTNGYLLESRGASLLVDPYFSRASFSRVALNLPVRSDPRLVEWALMKGRVPRRVDAVLVTHGHVDHLLDAPEVVRRTGARLIASPATVAVARSAAVEPLVNAAAARWGQIFQAGSARIRVLRASHDRILGHVPFPGDAPRRRPPRTPSDWVVGTPLAFLIEMGGQRIYLDSGGVPGAPLPGVGGKRVDLAILGVALPDARGRLPAMLAHLRPRVFLPSHQDNFFRPLPRGFVFGPLTDFPAVRRLAQQRRQPLLFLGHFETWTLR